MVQRLFLQTWINTHKGNSFRLDLPAKYIVCPDCHGRGRCLIDGLRGVDVTQSLTEDPDFSEAYMRGDYDTDCTECQGLRVRLIIDEDQLHPRMIARLRHMEREERLYQAEIHMEQKRGC